MRISLNNLLDRCHHRLDIDNGFATLYCLGLASAYVISLYILVPLRVRTLDRDHPTHIQWRALASIVVTVGAIVTYPLLFCDYSSKAAGSTSFSIFETLFRLQGIPGVLAHTLLIYLGPNVASLLCMYDSRQRAIARKEQPNPFLLEVYRQLVYPLLDSLLYPKTTRELWRNIRNYLVAPWTEEVVFRACMIPVLLGSHMSPVRVALISPLFFGVAHIHHAVNRLSQGERAKIVILTTVFQFAYTSLFGSYAAHAFIRTGSVMAVTMSHAYCNMMGLPDFGFFFDEWHPLYRYRILLAMAFLVGCVGFQQCFSRNVLLPLPSVLPSAVYGQ